MRTAILAALVPAALALPCPALASSVIAAVPVPPPSDYEVVDATARIILARAQSAAGQEVRFKVEEVLKGAPAKFMHVQGRLIAASATAGDGFRDGRLYLAFLDEEEGVWSFSDLAEAGIQEVEPGDAWLRTVRLFAGISSLDNGEREKAALRDLKEAAEEDRDGRYPEGLAERIGRHFADPSVYKSFSDLMDLYWNAETDGDRLAVLWAVFGGDHPEAPGFFRGQLFAGEPDWLLQPAAAWFRANPDELPQMKDLARIYLGFPPGERGIVLSLMLDAADLEDGPLLWTLLPGSDRGEVRSLVQGILPEADPIRERLGIPPDERLKTDLLAVWLEPNPYWSGRSLLESLLREGQDPRWRAVESLEELAKAFEASKERATRRDILFELLGRAGSPDLPVVWRLLRQAERWEADLLLEWAAAEVPSYEDLVSLYRGARSDEERDRALWVVGAAWRSGQLGRLLSEVGALGQGTSLDRRLDRLARAFLSCPSDTARAGILTELDNNLATAGDLPVMLELLRGMAPWEALVLARWFAQNPSPEALPALQRLSSLPPVVEDLWMVQALAAAGDPEVLDVAVRDLRVPGNELNVWALGIVAYSPLPAAAEEALRILAEGGRPLVNLLDAFGEVTNASPLREWFFREVLGSEAADEHARERALTYLQRAFGEELSSGQEPSSEPRP